MKKFRIIILFLVGSLLISSCEKNFEPEIYGQLFGTNFPKTESDYEAYTMTCYTPFLVNWVYMLAGNLQVGFYVPSRGHLALFESTSDYCAPLTVDGSGWNLKLSKGNYDDCVLYGRAGNSDPSNFEKVRDITRFTEIISTLEKATVLSETKKNNLLGEARFCRGMVMYYLLHIYGPVPVILDPALIGNTEAEQNMVRPTLAKMAEWITADLEFGVANMAKTAPKGRYTADYARFCLMRHYLNEGSHMTGYYDKAIDMYTALKTSGFGLFTAGATPFADQFKIANKFNKEVIMAVSTSKSGDGSDKNGNFNPLSMIIVPKDAAQYADVANTIPTPFVNQPSSWSMQYNVATKYYDTYESGDARKNVILTSYVKKDAARTLITVADIGVKWSGYILNKFPIETTDPFQPTDIPLARWADVLLMNAEAVARKTQAVPTGEALQGVNDVRARAGLAPLSGDAVASYNGFMDALLAERGHEFLYEGFRKIDLIRFNKYRHNCTVIKGYVPTHQYMPLPNYSVQQAAAYGKTLTQTFERPGFASDL